MFHYSMFEVIQNTDTKVVASSTFFKLREIADKKGDKSVEEFNSKAKPTPIGDELNITTKILQKAIIDFTAGHRPEIEFLNIRDEKMHENMESLRTPTMNYAVGLPLFVKDNPIGVLWGIRKDPLNHLQRREVIRQLSSLFEVIEFVVAKELDGNQDAYMARKNIEKSDSNSMSRYLFYTKIPHQQEPVTSIIFRSHSYKKNYRLDASFIVPTTNGYSVSLKRFIPEKQNDTNIVLLMIPGFFCRRSVMDKLAREMCLSYGYKVFSMDMRGRSRQTLPPHGIRDGWTVDDYVQDDFPAVLKWIKEHHPDDRLVVVGHSMGGMIPRFYTSSYNIIRRIKRDATLPDPEKYIEGIVSITSPNYITLKSNFMGFDTLKKGVNMIPPNFLLDFLINFTTTSVHTAFTTIDLNKFFKFLLNMHSSLRQFSFTIGTKVVNIKDFVGYKQISPSEWYFLIEDVFCEESTKVILQFIRSQLSSEKAFLSYDGRINYTAEQRNFRLPLYSVVGTVDAIVPAEILEEDLQYFNTKNKVTVKYEQGHLGIVFHMPTVKKICKGVDEWIRAL
ncbi:MAG: alpha/beta fold hydrolase [Leptospiraceae bacterium]|nr:alpha/beta fold hydrolase [Leptospiraceae bacterium]